MKKKGKSQLVSRVDHRIIHRCMYAHNVKLRKRNG